MKSVKIGKIQLSEIMYFSKCGEHTLALLKGDKQEIIDHSLQRLEALLPGKSFFRIHRGYLVNLMEVDEIIPGHTPTNVVLKDGRKLPISKRRRKALIDLIDPI